MDSIGFHNSGFWGVRFGVLRISLRRRLVEVSFLEVDRQRYGLVTQ